MNNEEIQAFVNLMKGAFMKAIDEVEEEDRQEKTPLQEVYQTTRPLVNQAMQDHEQAEDFIKVCRYMMSTLPPEASEMYTKGFNNLLEHLDTLKRIVQSYHRAVGQAVQEEQGHE